MPAQVETIKDALGRTVEKPRYGGTLNVVLQADVQSFDSLNLDQSGIWTMHLTNEKLSVGDFVAGPSGKNEVTWNMPGIWDIARETGQLAESWEVQGNDTIIFRIRKGIRFHNKPPVNGREVVAEDVAYSMRRVMAAGTFLGNAFSVGKPGDNGPKSITATDKYTVVVKTPPESQGNLLQNLNVGVRIIAKEVVDQYKDLTDWRSAHGTGAYMLTDYVRDSSISFKRNPDYWRDHPLYPGMKMPFPDGVRALIIPDTSTQTAAIRTGKIDSMYGVLPTEVETLLKSRPDLNKYKFLQFLGPALWFRLDKELPFKDLKVRRAIMMAIDREGIIQGYYKGEASKFNHPILNVGELADIFTPLDKLPKTVQENYTYNPDMAKKLLTEAGYPNGFKTKIVCPQGAVDLLSIVKDNLAKVGIQADLDVKETGVWATIQRNSTHDEMLYVAITNIYYTTPLAYLQSLIPVYNHSRGVDQYVEDYYKEKILPNQVLKDKELRANLKALVPYLLDLVWVVELPSAYLFTIWQPWVKGFNGEYSVGRGNHGDYSLYVWIDKEAKLKATGQE
ncbi:MAG: ABC transporter substrate-binding protein [Dehalococcoidia bacterium]|nr:ABC transporter substrate-binding protein [Dehalococcoidia bacterium]